MEQVIAEPDVRADIVDAMRDLACRGAGVRELVECVQLKLGLKPDALLPVLWYFMKAFYLKLGEVLPIREWLGARNDREIDSLVLPAISGTKAQWSSSLDDRCQQKPRSDNSRKV